VRGALAALLAALTAAAVVAASSGAATVSRASAEAAVAQVGDKAFGAVGVRGEGSDSAESAIDKGRIAIGAGAASVTATDDGPTGDATASGEDIDLLGGRVQVRSVTRSASVGDEPEGEVIGLRLDGTAYGPIRKPRTFDLGNGAELVLNEGDTGLHLVSDDLDARVAIASVTTFDKQVPDPTPSPKPEPKPTRSPKPKSTATPKPKEPKTPPRLTAGGYAFPVVGDVNYDSTFGAARAAPIVAHEGNDIFAEFGSPAVAVHDGRITKVGTLPISGNRLWVVTDDGDAFFYAHLSSFSNAARNGNRVKAGEVLGFIGNTGDAEPTPPHLHFEVHPGGIDEDAVDPYPILRAWQGDKKVPPGAWVQELGADATERPGALVTVRDFIAE
jgi:murein DD-endopeptidase MepM/ murein hydrolase activator NlpD